MIFQLLIAAAVIPRAIVTQPVRGSSSSAYPYEIGSGMLGWQMKIILGVLIIGMFLIAVFSLFIRRCLEDSASNGVGPRPPASTIATVRLRRFSRGLDSSVIETFPVFVYSDVKKLKSGDGALECAVCISEFADDDLLRLLPKCHHVFHPDCIDAWLASHSTCPVCRANLARLDNLGESEFNHELIQPRTDNEEPLSEQDSQNRIVIDVEEQRPVAKFPRSHSTGHSLVRPGENCERYTLRLPEDVRMQIAALERTKSCGCAAVLPREGSSRRGWRGGGDGGVSRGGRRWGQDRWMFTVTPPFIAKAGSVGKNDRAQSSSSAGPAV